MTIKMLALVWVAEGFINRQNVPLQLLVPCPLAAAVIVSGLDQSVIVVDKRIPHYLVRACPKGRRLQFAVTDSRRSLPVAASFINMRLFGQVL